MSIFRNLRLESSSITLLLILTFIVGPTIQAQDSQEDQKRRKLSFWDLQDGAFDISSLLLRPEGFMPVPIIVTEPAVGLGGDAALLFLKPQKRNY